MTDEAPVTHSIVLGGTTKARRMPTRLTLVHKLLGSEHVYTSPDLRGLHVSAPTQAQAQREAIVVVDAIAAEMGVSPPIVTFREFAEAA